MKKRTTIKTLATGVVLAACATGLHAATDVYRQIIVHGTDDSVLATYYESELSYLEFVEKEEVYPNAEVYTNGNILIKLSSEVKFKMVKVEGGVDYTLTDNGTPITAWDATKHIDTFYIGEYEVTQGLYKEVKGTVPSDQSMIGDNYPVATVSWDMIAGSEDNFLTAINKLLAEIKKNNPAVATALGDREFRLPSEWEWEYAAAGGKEYKTLGYYFSGTSESTTEALETVAVNSVSPNKATSVAEVGSKLPNNLGLYDMSGNVYEWCSGLGYPADPTTPGYQSSTSTTLNTSNRPYRSGRWGNDSAKYFLVNMRNDNVSSYISSMDSAGFRLVF
ncbi:MAG: formylglycine-generating enzyme family protein [Bacteroides sp.]|nr:formylglycine-generating enzyme family protein [Bacteroides sp.]MBD5332876.1 formylglycine-generating enzyme family protein [Bacteroides sp.]